MEPGSPLVVILAPTSAVLLQVACMAGSGLLSQCSEIYLDSNSKILCLLKTKNPSATFYAKNSAFVKSRTSRPNQMSGSSLIPISFWNVTLLEVIRSKRYLETGKKTWLILAIPTAVEIRVMRSLEEGFAPGDAEMAREGMRANIPLDRMRNLTTSRRSCFFWRQMIATL